MPRAGIEPATFPLGGGRAIHCATGANLAGTWNSTLFEELIPWIAGRDS